MQLKLDDSMFFDNDKSIETGAFNHNENNESVKNLRESRYRKYQTKLRELSEHFLLH
jgi:hypothetical protein